MFTDVFHSIDFDFKLNQIFAGYFDPTNVFTDRLRYLIQVGSSRSVEVVEESELSRRISVNEHRSVA